MEKISHSQLHGQIDAKLDRLLDGQKAAFELLNPLKDMVSRHDAVMDNFKDHDINKISKRSNDSIILAFVGGCTALAAIVFQVYEAMKK
ncbi:MAG: hypothetical protein A3F67_05195 [Verrucomicrobia bacterium RIFCSPHIGHO2_12_FULL_41_10]|nr:MAG: hypothetical protein A3F67_05195 [Verrucomicrobia bacterium RIFCSPHIGHO2_12_FULL_41_10]